MGGEQAAEWPLTVQMTARRCQSLHFSSPGILKYAAYLDESKYEYGKRNGRDVSMCDSNGRERAERRE